MKLQKIVNRLQKLHPKEIDLSLDRVKNLCTKLGNPLDLETFEGVIDDYEKQLNKIQKIKKIEELEKSLSSNMNEQAFTELISLKNSNNL